MMQVRTNPQAIATIKEKISNKMQTALQTRGQIVTWHMNEHVRNPLPRLAKAFSDPGHWARLVGRSYHIVTNHNYIERVLDGREYYKFALRGLAEKLYALPLTRTRMEALLSRLQTLYTAACTHGEQFFVDHEVYLFQCELNNFIFTSRSVMDNVATLMHAVYGPKTSGNVDTSFSDFVGRIVGDGLTPLPQGKIVDADMHNYVQYRLSWFWRLRDVRDYVTHIGSLELRFYDTGDGIIRIYIQDQFEVNELIQDVMSGVDDFFKFADLHCAQYIAEQSRLEPPSVP